MLMTMNLRKIGGLLFYSILLLSLWKGYAICGTEKNIMLAPEGEGSAWNLPAGTYGEDEQGDSGAEQGESPMPGQGNFSDPGRGGSPIPGGGSADPGGSPQPPQGGNVGPGGSPRRAN